MTRSYFNNIRDIILNQLSEAQNAVDICVAWMTDPEIYSRLCLKAREGIKVRLIIHDDEINEKYVFEHNELIQSSGKVFLGNHHNKFCIIDKQKIITGSYNWTVKAKNRGIGENIIINDDNENVLNFSSTFNDLLEESTEYIPNSEIEFEDQIEFNEEPSAPLKSEDKPIISGDDDQEIQNRWVGKTLGEIWTKEKVVCVFWMQSGKHYSFFIELKSKRIIVRFATTFTLVKLEEEHHYALFSGYTAHQKHQALHRRSEIQKKIEEFKKGHTGQK